MIDIGAAAAVASGTGYGLANFLGGLASRRHAVVLVMLSSHTAALTVVLLAAWLLPGQPHPRDLFVGALAGLLAAAGAGLAYRCFATAQIGVSAALLGTTQLAVPATVAGVTGRPAPPAVAVGLVASAVAVAVLGWPSTGEGTGPRTAVLAVTAGAAFGSYHATVSITDSASGLWPVAAAEATIVGVAAVAVLILRLPLPRPASSGVAVATGLAVTAANLAGLVAVRGAGLSTAGGTIALLPGATTVLLTRLILRERLTWRAGAGLLFAAVAILLLCAGATT